MYTGCYKWELTQEEMADWYSKRLPAPTDLKVNQYLLLENKNEEVVDYYLLTKNGLVKVKYPQIGNDFTGQVRPRNPEQYCAIDLLLRQEPKIKVLRGVYGSGKDYLMLNAALNLLNKDSFEKIVFVRPHITVAGLPDIGALPGTAEEKLSWTLAPLYDKIGGEEGVKYLIENNQLELVPMNFIRGRSFNNSIIYMTEGQNMTAELTKLLIGRVGENSELWINADNHQVDKRLFEQDNGINKMIEKFAGHELFGYVYLPKTERSQVAAMADLLDN